MNPHYRGGGCSQPQAPPPTLQGFPPPPAPRFDGLLHGSLDSTTASVGFETDHTRPQYEHLPQPTGGGTDFLSHHCSQGPKNCMQCYSKLHQQHHPLVSRVGKLMVDAATMTEPEETGAMSGLGLQGNAEIGAVSTGTSSTRWGNLAGAPTEKVAEYLTSLRQFLKLSAPGEKRRLGDVKIVTAADGSRLYCCPECHVAYSDKALLEPHLASHKIERRFVCGVCGAGLKRKEHLDRHQLSHTDERPYSCAACPKTFKRNEHLARHYIVHSGEKAQGAEKRFVCGVCGTGHARREYLERHQLSHSDERPHGCSACHKSFKRNEHLARHLLTHSGLKPHVCLECGKAFYRKDHLRKHLSVHEIKRGRLGCNSMV